MKLPTYHELRMHIDHGSPVNLRIPVIGSFFWSFWRFIFTRVLHLPVPHAEEIQIISRAVLLVQALLLECFADHLIHHARGVPEPVQDCLHSISLGYSLRPHWGQHIHGEPLPGSDLAHYLQCDLNRYQMQAFAVLISVPRSATAKELLFYM